jgi:hypothetical protein
MKNDILTQDISTSRTSNSEYLLDRMANSLVISTIHYNDITIKENGILEKDLELTLMNVNCFHIKKGGSMRILEDLSLTPSRWMSRKSLYNLD